MRPFEGPLSALATCLADALGPALPGRAFGAFGTKPVRGRTRIPATRGADPAEAWRQVLLFAADPAETIEAAIAQTDIDSFCLVIDQFEESFRWARERGPSEVQVMVDLMRRVAEGEGRRFFILVTMRSDYIGDCGQFPGLPDVLNICQYFLPDARGTSGCCNASSRQRACSEARSIRRWPIAFASVSARSRIPCPCSSTR